MQIIKIDAKPNGAHGNQTWPDGMAVPAGYASIPQDMEIPDSFPFVDIEVNGSTVTAMTAREAPLPEPVQETPTQLDRIEAQALYTALMTDTLLEEEEADV